MRPGAAAVLVLIAGLLPVGGCNKLIGLDGFEVAGTGGQGGSGGSVQCGQALVPNDKVVRSCVLWDSCSPFVPASSISNCISLNVQQAFLGTSCTANATTCADVELCEGYGFASTQCAGGQSGWRCDSNNTAIYCKAGQGYFVSCAKRGGQCTMYDSNNDSVPDTANCKVLDQCAAGSSACDGEIAYNCIGGTGYGAVCTNLGAHCLTQAGQANCYLASPVCPGTVAPCDGNVAQACDTGQLLRYDCGSVGLVCDSEAAGPYCVSPGCTLADAQSCKESCTNSVAHLCYGGARFDVDCKAYGFATCQELDDPTSGGIGHYVLCSN